MKKTIFLGLITVFSYSFALAQQSLIGTNAPDLVFTKVLNDQQKAYKLSDFRGKVVLLDFWATWCAPCIHSFPEMDSLQKKFGKDLKIITITSDSETRIGKFLEKFRTNLAIAIDNENALAKIFPHRSIPHTILIDKKGIIRAITASSSIDENLIGQVIRGESISLEEKIEDLNFDPNKNSLSNTPNVLGQITLTPYKKGLPSMSKNFTEGRMTFVNLLPSTIYEVLYDIPTNNRLSWEADKTKQKWVDENLYCLEIIAPDKTEKQAKQALIDYLQIMLPIKTKIEKREKKVKILQRCENSPAWVKADPSKPSSSQGGGNGFEMQNSPVNNFANYLENQLNIPVIDETGLTEKYDLQIKWYYENPEKIHEELKKWDLVLTDAIRTIDILVFTNNTRD